MPKHVVKFRESDFPSLADAEVGGKLTLTIEAEIRDVEERDGDRIFSAEVLSDSVSGSEGEKKKPEEKAAPRMMPKLFEEEVPEAMMA